MTRGGSVLVLVLVLVAGMAVVAAVVSSRAGAAVQDLESSQGAARSRAVAMSGVEAILAEMQRQRAALLRGSEPELARTIEFPVDGGRWRGVVRIISARDEDADTSEARVQSAAAGVDVNTAPDRMLRELAVLGPDGAKKIVEERGRGMFGSPGEVERVLGADAADEARRVLTMFSADPEVESGVGASGVNGRARVDLSALKDDAMGAALAGIAGQEAGARLARELAGKAPKTRSELVAAMRRGGLDQELWGVVLDRTRVSSSELALGRIDVNRAGEAVLAAVPGFTVDAARELVSVRQTLGEAERRSLAWPVTRGVLTAEQFERGADLLTTRSMQWRVRIEAGLADGAERGVPAGDAVLRWAVRLEMIVDASGPAARLAYLGDMTSAESIGVLTRAIRADRPAEAPERTEAVAPTGGAGPAAPAPKPSTNSGGPRGRWAPIAGPRAGGATP